MPAKVFDFVFPSPVSLEEMASATVAVWLWRQKIDTFRVDPETKIRGRITIESMSSNLRAIGSERFNNWKKIPVKSMLPNVPSIIVNQIEKYTVCIENSIVDWMNYHFKNVFRYHRKNRYDILNDFDDFVCDFDASIHYDKTAKRIIHCDKISDIEKFQIACLYYYEEDILRIWPNVSSNVRLTEFKSHQVIYWISRLKQELEEVGNSTVCDYISQGDGMVNSLVANWSTIDYYMNHSSEYERLRIAEYLSSNHPKIFCRYVLPRLNEVEIDAILNDNGIRIVVQLSRSIKNEDYVTAAWMYFKSKVDENDFVQLFKDVFTERFCVIIASEDVISALCIIWKNSPYNLKRSMINRVLPNAKNASIKLYKLHYVSDDSSSDSSHDWFDIELCDSDYDLAEVYYIASANECQPLFFSILADATLKERNNFWLENWQHCVRNYEQYDWKHLMDSCFESEDEMYEFKKTVWFDYENIAQICYEWLENASFEKLEFFFNLCKLGKETIESFKQRLLLKLKTLPIDAEYLITHALKSFVAFIDSAYDNFQLANEYKIRLLSTSTISNLLSLVNSHKFSIVKKIVDTMVPRDFDAISLKKRFVDSLRHHFIYHARYSFNAEKLQDFLLWCLRDEDNIEKFKQSVFIDEIIHNWTEALRNSGSSTSKKFSENQDKFLEWYYLSSETVEEMKKNVYSKICSLK